LTALRVGVLLGAFTGLALAVVHLRSEQTRCAFRTLAQESRCVELRRELWRLQTGVARLRAPQRVRDSLDWFQTDLVTPGFDSGRRAVRLAMDPTIE